MLGNPGFLSEVQAKIMGRIAAWLDKGFSVSVVPKQNEECKAMISNSTSTTHILVCMYICILYVYL